MLNLTLDQKAAPLLETVAYPTAENWALLCSSEQVQRIVGELNDVLRFTLEESKAGRFRTLGEFGDALFARVGAIHAANPDAGIQDSESYIAIARFFSLNLGQPYLYDYFRYGGA